MKNYGKDYKKTEKGYEYVGEWYETSLSAEELKREARRAGTRLLLSCVLLIVGLSVNNIGSRSFWVLIPYAAMILPVIYGWMGFAALMRTAKRQKQAEEGAQSVAKDREQNAANEGVPSAAKDRGQNAANEGVPSVAKDRVQNVAEEENMADARRGEVTVIEMPEHAFHLKRSEYEQAFRRPLRSGIAVAVLAWTSFAADLVIVTAYREQAVWPVELLFAADAALLLLLGAWMAVGAWKTHRSVHKL